MTWRALYALALLLAEFYFMVWFLRNQPVRWWRIGVILILLYVVKIIGAKLVSLSLRDWQVMSTVASEMHGGYRQPGSMLGLIILGPLLVKWIAPKISWRNFFDGWVIFSAFSFGLWRVSCYIKGCCLGGPCDHGYCLEYPKGTHVYREHLFHGLIPPGADHSLAVFPLHFAFMALAFAIGLFLLWFYRHRAYEGQLVLLFLFLHEGGKALLEPLREPVVAGLQTPSMIMSLTALAVMLVIGFRSNRWWTLKDR